MISSENVSEDVTTMIRVPGDPHCACDLELFLRLFIVAKCGNVIRNLLWQLRGISSMALKMGTNSPQFQQQNEVNQVAIFGNHLMQTVMAKTAGEVCWKSYQVGKTNISSHGND